MVDETVSPIFDWDSGNRAHCRRHGVALAEIEVLLRGTPRIAPDLKHAHLGGPADCRRPYSAGTPAVRGLYDPGKVRTTDHRRVSARYMHEKEIRNYEAQSPENDH
jgi:uncharacterized DUF497 family protein